MVYKFFDKKAKGSGIIIEVKPGKQLVEELHKPSIKNLKKQFILD